MRHLTELELMAVELAAGYEDLMPTPDYARALKRAKKKLAEQSFWQGLEDAYDDGRKRANLDKKPDTTQYSLVPMYQYMYFEGYRSVLPRVTNPLEVVLKPL